jgi:hypothetical protein
MAALAERRGESRGFAPVDRSIAVSVAAKHGRGTILARLARLEAQARRPGATPLDRQLAADWRSILAAKDASGAPEASFSDTGEPSG